MREIVGAVAVMEGKARAISGVRVLGRYRLADPADQAGRRLHRPADDAVLLPDPAEHARSTRTGSNNPPGSGPYYVAERVVNRRIVLKRNPYYRGGRPANVDQIVVTVGDSGEGCLLAVEQDRLDHCFASIPNSTILRRLAEQYGINRPGGQFFRQPDCSDAASRLQPRSAGVQGAGPDRVEEGDQLRDRPPGARPRVHLSRRHAHRPDAAARARARREHLPARGSRPGDGTQVARQGEAQADRRSSTTRPTTASGSRSRRRSGST